MNLSELPTYIVNDETKNLRKKLLNLVIPDISLLNQDGNFLKLKREDTFRLVIFFFSLTGNPIKSLPKNWNNISGASGCTLENCKFRDSYDKFIINNAIPVGVSSQSSDDLKEMTLRLNIPYDVLSDQNLNLASALGIPTFSVDNRTFIKRITLIVDKCTIKNVFYPILDTNKHVTEVMKWLKEN